MAPNAPSGAAFMTMVRTLNTISIEPLDAVEDGRADLPMRVEGDAEDHGHEDDLQDVALDERLDDAGRDDVDEELPPLLALAGLDQLR